MRPTVKGKKFSLQLHLRLVMTHKPIQLNNLCLSFPQKTCFEDFSTQIYFSSRIALIGRNGSGKSTLLHMLKGIFEASDIIVGYVPQVIEEFDTRSGGQRLNKAITQALAKKPDILLLDEPTNHLDRHNRTSLIRMLKSYAGTLIIVSHDTELLLELIDTLWHIDSGKIHVFSGSYDDYMIEKKKQYLSLESDFSILQKQKKTMHEALMQEQERASKSKAKGEKNIKNQKWPTVVSSAKARRAQETSGHKKAGIELKKQDLLEQLSTLHLPEIITPKFVLTSASKCDGVVISEGTVGYGSPLIINIDLSLPSNGRIALIGNNGSGKTTLLKAILNDLDVRKTGTWQVPKRNNIGYLDQHYKTLSPHKNSLEIIAELVPTWSYAEVRKHLNDFLFRKNEEVNTPVYALSGGEKARLSLAQIAAKTPKLLLLDEITNNLDLETKEHVIQILKAYPGAMIVISHDEDFLDKIEVRDRFKI